uniref:Uncharacterized protein n=1 Tax=Oryza punctata TaxID=4537 RepID=A0A0E0JQX0_ORYPU
MAIAAVGEADGAEAVAGHLVDAKTPSTNITGLSGEGSTDHIIPRVILISCLFLVFSPPLLRRNSGEPLALLWTIALLISAYLFFLISTFSRTIRPSTVHISYGVLLADATDAVAGPGIGFAVMHLATGWTAGLLGYAYADHLQRIGTETAAMRVAPPTFLTEEDETSFKIHRGGVSAFSGFVSLLMSTAGALLLRLLPPDMLPIFVAFLSILEGSAIFIWVAFVVSLIALHHFDFMFVFIGPYLVVSFLLLMLLTHFVFAGDTIWAMLLWFLMLAVAGLLGYLLSVHAQYNQMMLSRLSLEMGNGDVLQMVKL